MGWKGNLRTFSATMNRIDRESKRRHKELERQQKEYEKMEALEQAKYEVDVYENYIERIQSLHKEVSEKIDWFAIEKEEKPIEPTQVYEKMKKAQYEFETFKPNFFHKLFKRVEKKKKILKNNMDKAKILDEKNYIDNISKYQNDFEEWEYKTCLASKVIKNENKSILEVIKEYRVFDEIEELGTELSFNLVDNTLSIEIQIHSDDIIPIEIKSLLKSGKLSIKKLPKGTYNELFQDYVCSAVLRIAREIFALLPLEAVVITAKDELLNPATGHKEKTPILSTFIVRKTLEALNLDYIDPSDSMENFLYNMNFKKTVGFYPVDAVCIKELNIE